MTLDIFMPSRIHRVDDAALIDVESQIGHLTLLPRHIDCAAELVCGLVRVRDEDGEERYMGIDGGTLVKIDDRVTISTPRAVVNRELGTIHETLAQRRRQRETRERENSRALVRLELELARSLFEQEQHRE